LGEWSLLSPAVLSTIGTYTLSGACTDQGNVTGIKIPFITNILSGTFTPSGGATFNVVGDVAQDSVASSEGSFGITGTVTFSTSCFSSGTIKSGTFPSGSFIIGNSVALEIGTSNGTVAFLGALNLDKNEIRGDYTVSGGTCDQAGTAVLVASSPWDY
jgi:rRNA maturation protein Nop10